MKPCPTPPGDEIGGISWDPLHLSTRSWGITIQGGFVFQIAALKTPKGYLKFPLTGSTESVI